MAAEHAISSLKIKLTQTLQETANIQREGYLQSKFHLNLLTVLISPKL